MRQRWIAWWFPRAEGNENGYRVSVLHKEKSSVDEWWCGNTTM